MAFALPFDLTGIPSILVLILLLIIGIVIIILIAKIVLFILPAAIIALIVWFLTGGSLFWAGIAFLIVAFISLIARI
ncbi:MAG TPA: hypothetical protein VK209_05705 [Candidatus Sulfotelmatobacter sp.]|nr:hypothetical protein [Candidatus Sulfotelmatobacter sp.]